MEIRDQTGDMINPMPSKQKQKLESTKQQNKELSWTSQLYKDAVEQVTKVVGGQREKVAENPRICKEALW